MEPKVTAQAWPTSTIAAALAGEKPISTRSGATTATGTPKPATPCMKPENAQPTTSACASGSPTRRVMVVPITLIPPCLSMTLYRSTEVQMMERTKKLRLSPLALDIESRSTSAPKKSRASAATVSQEAAPALGALHLKASMVTSSTRRGRNARAPLMKLRVGPFSIRL